MQEAKDPQNPHCPENRERLRSWDKRHTDNQKIKPVPARFEKVQPIDKKLDQNLHGKHISHRPVEPAQRPYHSARQRRPIGQHAQNDRIDHDQTRDHITEQGAFNRSFYRRMRGL